MEIKFYKTNSLTDQASIAVLATKDSAFDGSFLTEKESQYVKKCIDKNDNFIAINQFYRLVFIVVIDANKSASLSLEDARKAGCRVQASLTDQGYENLIAFEANNDSEILLAFAEGIGLGSYKFTKYLKSSEEKKSPIKEVGLICQPLQQSQIDELVNVMKALHKVRDLVNEPVSFLFKGSSLISFRNCELKSFSETYKKMEYAPRLITSGPNAFIILFETRIDLDADLIEGISKEISVISKRITLMKKLDEETLLKISRCQETAMLIHENIVDKQRVLSGILKSDFFPTETYEKLRIILKDINSLLDHTSFSFERLEYLQNTFLGLVNIEQNKIIKIFTVVTVVLMPPTLVASIYGMNFKRLPELEWNFGYPFAVFLMVLSSASALYFFRRKKWL